MDVFALVRDPLSTLTSWFSVDAYVNDGRHPFAEALDTELASDLSDCHSKSERGITLLTWFWERYLEHLPAHRILRYEDIIATNGANLACISPGCAKLRAELTSRNGDQVNDADVSSSLREALFDSDGPFWTMYKKDTIRSTASY